MTFIKRAYDIARKQVYFCNAGDSLARVATLMHTHNIGSILVKKDTEVAGIITVNGMLRHMAKNKDSINTQAKDIMSSPVVTASYDIEMDELVDLFNKHKVSRMVLTDEKKNIVGVVRDIAVYKYMTFYKFDKEAKELFSSEYFNKLF